MKSAVALMISFVLVLSIMGCGSKEAETQGSGSSTIQSEELLDSRYSGKQTLQEYVDELQPYIDTLNTEDAGTMITFSVDGHKLLYKKTFNETIPAGNTEYFEIILDLEADSMQEMLQEIKENCGVENPIVEIIYCNPNGSVIASLEFSAQ